MASSTTGDLLDVSLEAPGERRVAGRRGALQRWVLAAASESDGNEPGQAYADIVRNLKRQARTFRLAEAKAVVAPTH